MNKLALSKILLLITDFLTLTSSFFIALYLIDSYKGNYTAYIPYTELDDRIYIHLFLSFLFIAWLTIRLRHYTYRKPFWLELKEIIRTLVIFAIFELSIISFSKLYFSRLLWIIVWGIALAVVPLGRVILKKWLIHSAWYLRKTVILGTGNNAFDAYKALQSERYLGLEITHFVSVNDICEEIKNLNIPMFSNVKKNRWKLATKKSDQFIIALEENENLERDDLLRYFSTNGYRFVSVIPTLRGLPLYSTDMSFMFSYEVMLLRVNNNLAKLSSRIQKRVVDFVGAFAIMLLLSPILLYLYYTVRKDGGNAIYGHPRIGQNGRKFRCLKFRTMVVNSQEVLDELLKNDPEARAEWEKDFKLKNDPRITKVGKFLRATSLDELPQLWNVLKGEMSLVGPRPIVADELERYQENVDYYLMAKPGMTGLWQVSGRNDVDYDTRVYFDSWYVKNWSLWNDIAILFKTVNVVLKRDGAY
ncbi:UDP-phosphate galactose phosphotransferase [Rodentibacter caecimuris]|uniref:undecaprenyl-phosphate galactose phosphotransferase WbaP n=1 Tax=Rodentibacter caecimuris TaxID=1796644 RepID=UPI0007514562|nr:MULTISPECIES: undecaprenyl-phosphate galactose phosphotransferase WbaP [Pasteurellaceae]AOF53837.1 Undecaprenyl-phosphate galactosephosphotransferase [Pasteurellaceae bacterium NI1060]MCQ9124471.1 undecaprenyl-phosphate galactose phosphotransferase WbaP [Rodentibacter heylii]MCR1837557.1 undecaprenyl-phosphate galactose phosphotransferase WbaP [Pasteurella caecimuris]MCU0107118.1 undecaprenyl-phosphate galactose phosphotransferase WbaP [Pasteurella caecimuris]MCX2960696.1 undecaprenyl-phosp